MLNLLNIGTRKRYHIAFYICLFRNMLNYENMKKSMKIVCSNKHVVPI